MTLNLNRRHILAGCLTACLPLPALADDVLRVPFRYYKDRTPVIDVRLNGQGPYPLTFATGATSNVIDWDLAQALNLPHVNQVKNFLLNSQTVSTGSIDKETDFQVQSVMAGPRDMGMRVFDSAPDKAADQAFHNRHVSDPDYPRGLLGTAFFLEMPCVVDYEASEIRFYADGVPGLSDFHPVQTRVADTDMAHDRSLTVTAMLGDDSLDCCLDTGGLVEVYLSSQYVKKHHLYNKFPTFTEQPLDRADPSKGMIRVVRMQDFQFGGVRFAEINVHLGDPKVSDHLADAGVRAVIGRSLLQQMQVAFQNNQVFIKPNAAFRAVSPPFSPPPSLD